MKRGFIIMFFLAGQILWGGDDWKFKEFAFWDTKPQAVSAKVAAPELKYLGEAFKLLGQKDFSFLYRKDRHHWAGISRFQKTLVLHIHDTTNLFNFRAQVNLGTGALKLYRGVFYQGKTAAQSAEQNAQRALAYLKRLSSGTEVFPGTAKAAQTPAPEPSAWDLLAAGNQRYVSGKTLHPRQDASRRTAVAQGQKPFTVVLTCSDSRVPPEILFDQGLGDLFVVRTAGHVVSPVEMGSIEYAVDHLKVRHILVLGHERCGAVDATIAGGHAPGSIPALVEAIAPAVETAKKQKGNLLDNAIAENVKLTEKRLQDSPILKEALKNGHLSISGAVADLDTGKVSLVK